MGYTGPGASTKIVLEMTAQPSTGVIKILFAKGEGKVGIWSGRWHRWWLTCYPLPVAPGLQGSQEPVEGASMNLPLRLRAESGAHTLRPGWQI